MRHLAIHIISYRSSSPSTHIFTVMLVSRAIDGTTKPVAWFLKQGAHAPLIFKRRSWWKYWLLMEKVHLRKVQTFVWSPPKPFEEGMHRHSYFHRQNLSRSFFLSTKSASVFVSVTRMIIRTVLLDQRKRTGYYQVPNQDTWGVYRIRRSLQFSYPLDSIYSFTSLYRFQIFLQSSDLNCQ